MLATQMPETPPEAKDVKQVKPQICPYLQRSYNFIDVSSLWLFHAHCVTSVNGVRMAVFALGVEFYHTSSGCVIEVRCHNLTVLSAQHYATFSIKLSDPSIHFPVCF